MSKWAEPEKLTTEKFTNLHKSAISNFIWCPLADVRPPRSTRGLSGVHVRSSSNTVCFAQGLRILLRSKDGLAQWGTQGATEAILGTCKLRFNNLDFGYASRDLLQFKIQSLASVRLCFSFLVSIVQFNKYQICHILELKTFSALRAVRITLHNTSSAWSDIV